MSHLRFRSRVASLIARSAEIVAVILVAAVSTAPVRAAEATPPAAPDKPVTTVRIGGSPADAEFRAAQQQSAAEYRAARSACRNGPAGERSACLRSAKERLDQARRQAKAAHDAASR